MPYGNLEGTLKKSFKIGANGVKLSSSAFKDGEMEKYKFIKINKNPVLVVEDAKTDAEGNQIITDFDLSIDKTFIKSISYIDEHTVSFNLTNGKSIKLSQYLSGFGDVSSSETELRNDDEVVIFDGRDGKRIKSSKKTISTEITDSTKESISTVGAVIDYVENYVGTVSDILNNRLQGL